MIPAVVEQCAGIDVGKTFVAVCIMIGPVNKEPRVEQRIYGTMNADLARLRDWLIAEGCTHVAMERTGPYWKPVFNGLIAAAMATQAAGYPEREAALLMLRDMQ